MMVSMAIAVVPRCDSTCESTNPMISQTIADLRHMTLDWQAALPDEVAARARFAWDDARRLAWSGGPRERDGVTLAAMPPEARHLAMAMLTTIVSPRGLRTVLAIMSLERELFLRENSSPRRDPERYYFQVFGDPNGSRWALRCEGHHLSISVSVVDGVVHCGPCFRATNPAQVPDGPRRGLRPLAEEEDVARALVESFRGAQRAAAIAATPPPADIVSGTTAVIPELPRIGLALTACNAGQRRLCEELCARWLDHWCPAIAEPWKKRVGSDETLHFSWQGSTVSGAPHYYRVHGKSLLIEWSNVQNNGNHVHAVLRDPHSAYG